MSATLIHYILNFPPYVDVVSSIRNPITRHAMLTGTHINSCWFMCDI